MAERPQSLLLKFPGTNCDQETARALESAGFSSEIRPIATVEKRSFDGIDLVVLSGGFSYGDYVMAGRLAQLEVERRFGDTLTRFRDDGGYLLGICNGFQILARLGLLPECSLIDNSSERFICRWVSLEKGTTESAFLDLLPESFQFPIAHAEGRLVTRDPRSAENFVRDGLAALRYTGDVNGSYARIAGLQDPGGQVLGLMPHPERFLYRNQHYDPDWDGDAEWGWGYYFFRSIHDRIAARTPAVTV